MTMVTKKAEAVKAQAKDQMEVLQQKREEMKRQSEVQSQGFLFVQCDTSELE